MPEAPVRARLTALTGAGLTTPEEPVPTFTDEPKFAGYVCAPNASAAALYQTANVYGQGFDPDDTLARLKAVAECLERLAIYNPTPEVFLSGPQQCDPAWFRVLSSAQIPDLPAFETELRSTTYRWWPVTERTSQSNSAIPAQTIFLSSFDGEPALRPERITTGAALGLAGTSEAFESGLLECIERDACIAAYLNQSPLRRIVNLPPAANELVDYLDRYRLEPHIFDVTTDLGVPTVLVIAVDRTGIGPAITTGSRAAWTYEKAIVSAILESIQSRRSGRLMRDTLFPAGLPSASEITSMDHRFFYWHAPERIADLAPWLETPRTVDFSTLNATSHAAACTRVLAAKGYRIFVADITLPPIRQAGFEVVKVVIPELHPLYLDERAKSLYSVHHGEIADNPALKPHPLT